MKHFPPMSAGKWPRRIICVLLQNIKSTNTSLKLLGQHKCKVAWQILICSNKLRKNEIVSGTEYIWCNRKQAKRRTKWKICILFQEDFSGWKLKDTYQNFVCWRQLSIVRPMAIFCNNYWQKVFTTYSGRFTIVESNYLY